MVYESLTMADGTLRINYIQRSQKKFNQLRAFLKSAYSESAGTDEHRIETSENLDDLVDHPEKVIGQTQ